MLTRYATRAAVLAAALLVSAACSDDNELTAPGSPDPVTVALVELEGGRPALYIQKSDGSARTRIHFNGAIG